MALLFDVSGSMEARLPDARDAARHVLSWLDQPRDEAAVFTFDTRLSEVTPFTDRLETLPGKLEAITPFGATSLHDAIARDGRRLGGSPGLRRAVIVFTDGNDNASRLTPTQVSAMASAIDVPVYMFGVVPRIDNPLAETGDVGRASRRCQGRWRIWRPGRAATRSSPACRPSAAPRRSRSSTSCGISTSLHSNRAANRAGIRSWSVHAARI